MEGRAKNRILRPVYVFFVCLLVCAAMAVVMITQSATQLELNERRATLQTEYDALQVEEQRLEGMLEYVKTDEYLLQYAREKLGYVLPGEYKFYRENDE